MIAHRRHRDRNRLRSAPDDARHHDRRRVGDRPGRRRQRLRRRGPAASTRSAPTPLIVTLRPALGGARAERTASPRSRSPPPRGRTRAARPQSREWPGHRAPRVDARRRLDATPPATFVGTTPSYADGARLRGRGRARCSPTTTSRSTRTVVVVGPDRRREPLRRGGPRRADAAASTASFQVAACPGRRAPTARRDQDDVVSRRSPRVQDALAATARVQRDHRPGNARRSGRPTPQAEMTRLKAQ